MDVLIAAYLAQSYHPELVASIHRSFELFEQFNVTEHELPILNLIATQDNRDDAEIHDAVLKEIRDQLARVMHAHHIALSDETRIDQYNEWLEALYVFQDLEDYSTIARWLESDMDPEEQLLEIINDLCVLTISELQDTLVSFEPELIDGMKQYVEFQDQKKVIAETTISHDETAIIERLKQYQSYIQPATAVGVSLAAAGVLVGRPIELYKSLLKLPWAGTDITQLARDIYSVILLSDAHAQPLSSTYRLYSHLFLKNLDVAQRVDIELIKFNLGFMDYVEKMQTARSTKVKMTPTQNGEHDDESV
jgi:hypothetical protein